MPQQRQAAGYAGEYDVSAGDDHRGGGGGGGGAPAAPPRYNEQYELEQVNAAATSGKAPPTKKVRMHTHPRHPRHPPRPRDVADGCCAPTRRALTPLLPSSRVGR